MVSEIAIGRASGQQGQEKDHAMHYDHLMQKVRDAAQGGINAMSTGEALTAALVLNRNDWLAKMDYTIAEALNHIDADTIPLIARAARQWQNECEDRAQVEAIAAQAQRVAELLPERPENDVGDPVRLATELVTYGDAPGYRDVSFRFNAQVIGPAGRSRAQAIELYIRPEDAETIVSHLVHVHKFAWRAGHRPIDAKEGEERPRWIDRYPG